MTAHPLESAIARLVEPATYDELRAAVKARAAQLRRSKGGDAAAPAAARPLLDAKAAKLDGALDALAQLAAIARPTRPRDGRVRHG